VLQTKMAELKTREANRPSRARACREGRWPIARRLIEQIDSRRDLTAQYVGELQVARERSISRSRGGRGPWRGGVPAGAVPRRARVAGGGRRCLALWAAAGRQGGRSSAAGWKSPPRRAPSSEPSTAGPVGYAEGYTGLGTLVILDHGSNNYSLYGYLLSLNVQRGEAVEAGAELGRVGPSPAGPPELYFELRIDGRSVDPVQWLKPR
jgi:murein DD-endopeptidase MepM/ murein hydrolase activator NlpD